MAVDGLTGLRRGSLVTHKQAAKSATDEELAAIESYLTKRGSINAKDEDGLALIHYAACHGNISLIRKLREHGADLNLLDGGSPPWRPVHYAIFHRQHEAEHELRKLGAEVPLPILKTIALEKSIASRSEKNTRVLPGRK